MLNQKEGKSIGHRLVLNIFSSLSLVRSLIYYTHILISPKRTSSLWDIKIG